LAAHRTRGDGRTLRCRAGRRRSRALSERPTTRERTSGPDEENQSLIDAALDAAEEKLASDPVVLDVREFQDAFDSLVIVSGRNDRQVRAIAEEVERVVGERAGIRPLRVEGLRAAQWVALDYGDVIIHVFDEEQREYYDLEHLWSAAPARRRAQRARSDS
jgi:ribosome-associated protein